LTEQFQVSRGVIREAIRALEITGFVKTRQGPAGGAFVTKPSLDHVGNVFMDLFLANKVSMPEMVHVRRIVEPEVSRLAAGNISEKGKRLLRQAGESEFKLLPDSAEFIAVNQEVHRILAEECGNYFLEAICKSMLRLTYEMVMAVDPSCREIHGPGEHAKVIDAVHDGKADQAAEAMAEHLDIFNDRLIRLEKIFRSNNTRPSDGNI
jgi:GntR family transcriptional regulator, transcriptional repressor for pyruvate dehydrogenase complex